MPDLATTDSAMNSAHAALVTSGFETYWSAAKINSEAVESTVRFCSGGTAAHQGPLPIWGFIDLKAHLNLNFKTRRNFTVEGFGYTRLTSIVG